MLDDQPHLYFLHFWATDDAKKLAEGLKAALAHVDVAKSQGRRIRVGNHCYTELGPPRRDQGARYDNPG
jgi:hypothetical protein